MKRAPILTLLVTSGLGPQAVAGPFQKPTFTLGGEVGVAARYLDNTRFTDPEGFGLNVGLRSELNVLMHLKFDAHYVEGRVFNPNEDRMFDLSLSGRTPRLIVAALDVHELYFRRSARPGDEVFYVMPGLAFLGDLVGTLKGTLGYAYIEADTPAGEDIGAHGGFLGLEYMLRTKLVDLNVRAAGHVVFDDGSPFGGVTADTDLFIKIPAGPVALGPRFDVAYRNYGLFGDGDLFGLKQDLTGRLSFAVQFGAGKARAEKGPKKKQS